MKDLSFPNMQVFCPYYVKDHMKAMLYWQMCDFIFQIKLSSVNRF